MPASEPTPIPVAGPDLDDTSAIPAGLGDVSGAEPAAHSPVPTAGEPVTRLPAQLPAQAGLLALAAEGDTAQRLAVGFLLSHSGNTRAAYTRDLADYGAWCDRMEVGVLAARRVHVDAYVEHLTRSGAAPSTVVRRLSAVSGFYAYAVDEGAIDRNPAARVRRPKVGENVQSTGLSKTEAGRLLAAAEAHSPRAAVVANLLLFCGLRVSELCHAEVGDLGWERGHRVLTVTRKGGKRQRMVVPPRAGELIDAYLAGRDSGPLVATATGRPLDRQGVWRLLRALAATAVPHLADTLHPHDLRHACATLALDAGASLRDVQDLLGHADSRTTRRYDRARHNLDRSPTYALAGLIDTGTDD
ncbi:tyrosine-type recombinase/integrase [Yinghuangia seranimata]|uniref:tyrosine-type recombinase/integrase n=1 Tax=Yinghuangia seranimata TaxID=408067 RepID=UPI00248B6CFC|nr:tyrosine-type recombinase/integrase [Yinghuangia seranimata]MDI2129734.1 tyrosine-type recombinase/integrase [Yinghuangia seranimata]